MFNLLKIILSCLSIDDIYYNSKINRINSTGSFIEYESDTE